MFKHHLNIFKQPFFPAHTLGEEMKAAWLQGNQPAASSHLCRIKTFVQSDMYIDQLHYSCFFLEAYPFFWQCIFPVTLSVRRSVSWLVGLSEQLFNCVLQKELANQ